MADRHRPNDGVNLPASGSFTPPPANAPHEVTLAGSERALPEQIMEARRNERELPTYNPKPMSDAAAAAYLGKSVEEIRAQRAALATGIVGPDGQAWNAPLTATPAIVFTDGAAATQPIVHPAAPSTRLRRVSRPLVAAVAAESVSTLGGDADGSTIVVERVNDAQQDQSVVPATMDHPLEGTSLTDPPHGELTDDAPIIAAEAALIPVEEAFPILPHMRAASNTDSPSRGLPTAATRPGKEITGGFGDVGEAQYFPLDGSEVGKVAIDLLQAIVTRIPNDLRFSMAATYPRVKVRATLEIECFAGDQSFQIIKVAKPHDATPIEIARAHADECVFILSADRVEMTDAGESVEPPDAMRLSLKLPVPRKRSVKTPSGGRILVDVAQ